MRRARRELRPGLSLIEVMMNLAIVSVLLLSVTASLRAMASQFKDNEATARTRQTATVMLDYMLTYIRQAKDVNFGAAPTSTDEASFSQLTVVDYFDRARPTATKWHTFRYDSTAKALKLSVNGGTEQTVLRNVQSLVFRAKPELDTLANVAMWRSVTIDMTLQTADTTGKLISMSFSGTSFARAIPLS